MRPTRAQAKAHNTPEKKTEQKAAPLKYLAVKYKFTGSYGGKSKRESTQYPDSLLLDEETAAGSAVIYFI
jgi:hypothetical protein